MLSAEEMEQQFAVCGMNEVLQSCKIKRTDRDPNVNTRHGVGAKGLVLGEELCHDPAVNWTRVVELGHDFADDATQVSSEHATLGRDSVFRHFAVTLGGDLVRVNTTVNYADKGGDAELLGIYFADAGQHLEHRMLVDHSVANCRSNVLYKGALQGDSAHSVWIGDVLIQAAAEGTDLAAELDRLTGRAWDEELEPFRYAGDGAPVRWLHAVG